MSDRPDSALWASAVWALHDGGMAWDEIARRLRTGRRFVHGLARGFQINERYKREIAALTCERLCGQAKPPEGGSSA